MSAFGTKRTFRNIRYPVAIGGKADMCRSDLRVNALERAILTRVRYVRSRGPLGGLGFFRRPAASGGPLGQCSAYIG